MAIDDLLDEHEQSERVRAWLRSNAIGLIGGVVLGLALIGGWQWWQRQQQQEHEQANSEYVAALDAISAGDLARAKPQVAALSDDLYATLAGLQLAKAQLEADQRAEAIATLRAATPADPALAGIVDVRLARLLIADGKAEEALALLEDAEQPAALDIRGDAAMALGRAELARTAWSQALTRLDSGAPQRTLIEIKLAAAGGKPQPEVQS